MMTKSFCRLQQMLLWCGVFLAYFLCWFQAQALPAGGVVQSGNTTITTTTGSSGFPVMNITQSSSTTLINWTGFNIGQNETVNFSQPGATSVAWNFISDSGGSTISGNLNANGLVILQDPNGFTVSGTASINTHSLIMTTAATPPGNFTASGPWTFSAPAPSAKIVNLGQITTAGNGGSIYLIASDIENSGTISAPNGNIGLCDGQTVMLSTSPNGLGLSAQVTLPAGSVNNQGKLIADAGSIIAQAQLINQNGLIQANSAQNVNGTIELLASGTLNLNAGSTISAEGNSQAAGGGGVTLAATTALNNNGSVVADGSSITATSVTVTQNGLLQANSLGNINGAVAINATGALNLQANSDILANGDPTATAASPGGFVVLDAPNRVPTGYTDSSASRISVLGTDGGQNGIVEILNRNHAISSTISSTYALLESPTTLTLSTAALSTTPSTVENLPFSALLPYSDIYLYNIEVSSPWILADSASPATLALTAMN
ncbi:MAG TPA: filamentous hemagglutinin N-terminal domain-containing protein, partial [Verrucomicrobiae bacterium]